MKLEVEIDEGDVLQFNDKTWVVTNLPGGLESNTADLNPVAGIERNFDRETLEELISYSGEFRLIRSEFLDIHDL